MDLQSVGCIPKEVAETGESSMGPNLRQGLRLMDDSTGKLVLAHATRSGMHPKAFAVGVSDRPGIGHAVRSAPVACAGSAAPV